MPKNFFKKDNTSEIVEANLLKYTFIAKRQELHKNIVPKKYRNNKKLATLLLENERINLLTKLNIGFTKSKIKQDEKNRIAINKLCTKKIEAYKKLHNFNKYLDIFNEEIHLNEIKNLERHNNFKKKKASNEPKIHCDLDNLLFRYGHIYNNQVKEQKDLRHKLDGLLRELGRKKEKYESIMYQLHKAAKLLKRIGDNALKSNKDREQALINLVSFQETSMADKKRRKMDMYMLGCKFKNDLEYSKFLQKKLGERHNSQVIYNSKKDIEQDKLSNVNEELITSMKHLVYISGDTDLKMIVDNVLKTKSNKESLFRHLMFLEQQCLELESSLSHDQNIAIDMKISNNNRYNHNECTLKNYFEKIQANSRNLNSTQELTVNMKAVYEELCDKIATFICRPLKIKLNDPLNEENIMDYMKKIENKSHELLIKIHCIENSCIRGQTEDIMTSDGESTQNLIIKDYNGIEVKMHQILQMQEIESKNDMCFDNMNDHSRKNLQTLTTCQE